MSEYQQMNNADWVEVLVGSYAEEQEPGLVRYRFYANSGALEEIGQVSGVKHPSFVAEHPHLPIVYSFCKREDNRGAMLAYALGDNGSLTLISEQPTGTGSPCHVSIDARGNYAFATIYASGEVVCFPLDVDGKLQPVCQSIQHVGSSAHPDRQTSAHAHSAVVDPFNRHVVVSDLGMDQVIVYQLQTTDLAPSSLLVQRSTVHTAPGAGPRHLKFTADGARAYGINELDGTVNLYRYDAERGELQIEQTVSTLPDDFDGSNTTAEIHLSPDGAFLYGSNRGHDSIAVYRIAPDNGHLTRIQLISSGGKTPRNFALSPNGRFLIAAHQDSDSLVIFSIDPCTGQLQPTGKEVHTPKPVSIIFLSSTESLA